MYQNLKKKICDITKSKYCLALNSGTSSLDLSLKVLGIGDDSEILAPTTTFIAPINSILYNKSNPIFMDVDKYGNLDSAKVIKFLKNETFFKNNFTINKKTKKKIKAVIIVHVFGNISNYETMIKLCKKRKIKVIEDASESLGSYFLFNKKRKHSGTYGDIGCISFNANKVITTGSGGAIITNNKKLFKRALYLSTQAKDDPIKFIHNDVGYNIKLNNLSAAIGLGQLENFKDILKKKKKIFEFYIKNINKLNNFEILSPSIRCQPNYWINILKIKSKKKYKLNDILDFFFKNEIQVRPIWYPNHLQIKMKNFQKYELRNFKNFHENHICLPSGYGLKKNELEKVANTICLLDTKI